MEKMDKKQLLKEADLISLFQKILSKWKQIACVAAIFLVIGVVMAFTSIKKYTVEVMVAPETSSSSLGGNLGSFANIVGFDLRSIEGGDAIYPLLYPDIIQSLPFLSSMMDVHVQTMDGVVDTTFSYYQARLQKKSWTAWLKGMPKRTINKIAGAISPSNDFKPSDPFVFDPYHLSRWQQDQIVRLNKAITIFVDKKTDVITLSFTDPDPYVAATMAEKVMDRLQECITEYRTSKSQNDYQYIEKLYLDAKSDYEQAQMEYAVYVDKHQSVSLQQYMIEQERLEADKELKNTLYTQCAQELQLSKAKIQESTPAFTTLKPAAIPARASSMRKLNIILIWMVLGVIIDVAYILLKEPVSQTWQKLFNQMVEE